MSEAEEQAEEGWQRLNPLSIVVGFSTNGVRVLLPAGVIFYTAVSESRQPDLALPGLIAALLLLMVLGFGTDALSWYRQRYRVGEADVRHEKGLLSRSARSVPFERIQDVSLEAKLVPRLLGLVEVRFETGAGGKDELKLAYVSREEGEKLRETLRLRNEQGIASTLDRTQDAPQEMASEPETARRLFAMSPRRLFVFGLLQFSLVVLAVLGGVVQQFEFLLPFDLWDADLWRAQIEQSGQMMAGLEQFGLIGRLLGIVAVLPALIVLGLATGVVRTFLRDFDFRLDRTAKGFRRRRGLLTKTDVVMPVHRVQALRVTTGLLRRIWGWHGLSFVSLAQDAGSSNHDVAPFAQMEEIAPIAHQAGFSLPAADTGWQKPSPQYYQDRAVLAAVIPVLGAVAALAKGYMLIGLALIGVGAVLMAREFWRWRKDRHALDPRQILSRRGCLVPRLQIASRVKLHSVEIAQGPLGRWRGYASLNFGLAGGRLSFKGLPVHDARRLRLAVLESIAAVDFARIPR